MNVLIDFDNVERRIRDRGCEYLVDRVFDTLSETRALKSVRARVRLYGGWYNGTSLTPRAKTLSADLAAHFPKKQALLTVGETNQVITQAELAYSLDAAPSTNLGYTYRPEEMPATLQCRSPVSIGCAISPCALASMEQAVVSGRCPAPGCTFSAQDLLYFGQQKLVDSMIVADACYMSGSAQNIPLIVVSSDDDVWPGIATALSMGVEVFHVGTRAGSPSRRYSGSAGRLYHSLKL